MVAPAPSVGASPDCTACGKIERFCTCSLAAAFEDADGSGSVCLADVTPRPASFLWRPYLPLGAVNLLVGDPGQGKSTLALHIAACVSAGRCLPGEQGERSPRRVLVLTAEDALAEVVRPRLDAGGADPERTFAIPGALRLSDDAGRQRLENEVHRRSPSLLIVDPLVAYCGSQTDTHRANQVRAIMAPLAELAQGHGMAVLAVMHLNKGGSSRAIYRAQGSVDFVAAARSALLVGSDPDEPERRALCHVKTNGAKQGPALGFRLADAGNGAARVEWTRDPPNVTRILGEPSEAETLSALEEAQVFLRGELADGPRPSKELLEAAESEGISASTLKRAKAGLGIAATKTASGWCWQPPEEVSQ